MGSEMCIRDSMPPEVLCAVCKLVSGRQLIALRLTYTTMKREADAEIAYRAAGCADFGLCQRLCLVHHGYFKLGWHSDEVNSARFSPDGTNIVSASWDETVRVWSVATGECVQTLEGHSGWVNSAQFSPDGTNIVSASGDKTVRVLDGQ